MALYVPSAKKSAQKRISELKMRGLFNPECRVFEERGKIWIPVKAKVRGAVEREGRKAEKKPRSMGEALSGIMGEDERRKVVASFDIIGGVAVVEIPEGMEKWEKEIAEALMNVHRNVRTVAKKEGPMEGEYRTRKLRVIAGEKSTETLYVESGAKMMLDVAKVYFSPRLSFERKRIAGLVKEGERVLALFAGVGPFPLVIAKEKKCWIASIELNPVAAEYMKRNVELNKVQGMAVICGDVRKVVPEGYKDWADRVLMPLPKGAEEFLDVAYEAAKDGGVIHFYTFADIKDPFGDARRKIFTHLPKEGVKIMGERIVRPFSPALVQVVVDFRLRKERI